MSRLGTMMNSDIAGSAAVPSYLVEVLPEPAGFFTATDAPPLSVRRPRRAKTPSSSFGATATATIGFRLARLGRGSARKSVDGRWFGHAKDDPTFPEYLEEIRNFREEMDRRDNTGSGPGECSDTSLTPTT